MIDAELWDLKVMSSKTDYMLNLFNILDNKTPPPPTRMFDYYVLLSHTEEPRDD